MKSIHDMTEEELIKEIEDAQENICFYWDRGYSLDCYEIASQQTYIDEVYRMIKQRI